MAAPPAPPWGVMPGHVGPLTSYRRQSPILVALDQNKTGTEVSHPLRRSGRSATCCGVAPVAPGGSLLERAQVRRGAAEREADVDAAVDQHAAWRNQKGHH